VHFKVNLLNLLNLLFAKFFWLALLDRGLSIRILLFDYMALDLPTPVSHREHSHAATHCTHPKSMFGNIRKLAKIKKNVQPLILGNSEFAKCEIWHFLNI
jgi:hypothetical protein